ncbi:Aminopeptidase N [Austwickia sp. TVS 96-490-7B]|uniref:aminopeptidase N n=1 Tax=Austwickia sp. TVS 96-490-7B TaxID=2830843 RepID=UPI001C5887C3|nr:aminopeptidase N [Austwickia sp. TVS 96-490-7B]MBW3085686.1 Aminopeptidase N [Austwickia sp. TVS 96-490-7B]
MAVLTHSESLRRADLLTVTSYDVTLDLDTGADTFDSISEVHFSCSQDGASTFIDVTALRVHEICLNGVDLDPREVTDGRLPLTDLATDNVVVVHATMGYRRDGQGLHRAVDPADGRHYVYGHLFLDAAPSVFACFDQPDLKAPYDVAVHAPDGWIVLGNGAACLDETRGPGWWRLARTAPLATYYVTICAGPYVSVRDDHDAIPLGIHARASLVQELHAQAPELLALTKAGLDHYRRLFDSGYPFEEYHQVFVPEFNAGAMENPGCVTFRDQMIFRGAVGDAERMARANTVLHEMAHMWFGDLVTMRWWDDLWLNESFAEYMATRACLEVTEFSSAWADFTLIRKSWGYAAERSPSTHPVASEATADTAQALHNFDGISYAKGASVLAQLVAYLGQDTFDAGVRIYLARHPYGNAECADFLTAMMEASGRDLQDWAQAWLRTSGADALEVALDGQDGRIVGAELRRTAPAEEELRRPHTIRIAGYAEGRRLWDIPAVLNDDAVCLSELIGEQIPAVLLPDAQSDTWATIHLSESSLAALPEELAAIPQVTARAMVWVSVIEGMRDGRIDPGAVVGLVAAAGPSEPDPLIQQQVFNDLIRPVVRIFMTPSRRADATATLAAAARQVARLSAPGSPSYLAAVRARAAWEPDETYLQALAVGNTRVEPLAEDADLRWAALTTLACRGVIDEGVLARRRDEDRTLAGELAYLKARASLPGAAENAWAWSQIVDAPQRSNYELNALAEGFWMVADAAGMEGYAERYFVDLPAMAGRLGEDALARVATVAFPSVMVSERVVDTARVALSSAELSDAVRRSMVDGTAVMEQALRSRRRWG